MTAREAVAWLAVAALAVALFVSRCGPGQGIAVVPGTVEAVAGADTSVTVSRDRIEEILDKIGKGSAWPDE